MFAWMNSMVAWMLPAVPRTVVKRVASRYIAGETRESALELAARLRDAGFRTTLDILGEDTETREHSVAAAAQYVELIEAMAAAGIERNLSLKLTGFGLRIDLDLCFDNLRRVLETAAEHDFFVRIDMEDSSVTDVTLDQYRRAREIHPRVGIVIQSRLRRTVDDARQLAAEGANVRLCKGIYREPVEVAYQDHEEVNDSFVEAARLLLDGDGSFVGLATHDLPLVGRLEAELASRGDPRQNNEFQALLGVPIRATLERLRDAGHGVRLYVPYGTEWYAYSVRRLKENPEMAGAITKSLFSRDRMDAATQD